CGAPVTMPWIERVAAVVEAYYPGQEGGNAVANVLTGAVNPSGKLPVSFPKRLTDTAAYLNYPGKKTVHYGEGVFVGYRYHDAKDIEPLFPFGHGLSYTSFEYSNLRVPSTAIPGEPVTVTVGVKNVGDRAGREVVQLYVSDVAASVQRPEKELKGFEKVSLEPGETVDVSFVLDERSLAFYDPDQKAWVAEAGEFVVLVGSSSRDIRAVGRFELCGGSG
ncbi:MAG: fibronectin type III-like domain-contianing protein, partial [Anaerolineae bacterium]|nr:fibronectin type III-like domain-contianing protein [Anaerolineae bacterium]